MACRFPRSSGRAAASWSLRVATRGRPALLSRLQDADFLSALWVLCLPLIEPVVLGQLQTEWRSKRSARADEDDEDDWDDDLPDFLSTPSRRQLRGQPGRHIRAYLAELLSKVPDALLQRLAEQDGAAPTHPGVAVIAASTALDPVETAMLDFVEKRVQTPAFSDFLRESQSCGARDNFACVAAALGLASSASMGCCMARRATSRTSCGSAICWEKN